MCQSPWAERRPSREKALSSALAGGSFELGDGMNEEDRAAIEFAFEDDWGDGGGESGAWVGVRGGGGGGWLSSLSAAAPEAPPGAQPAGGSEEDKEEEDDDDDEEEEEGEEEDKEAEDDGDWDAALRGERMPVGTRVFVDEGTAAGVSGRRAFPFFAIISRYLPGCRYGVRPQEARQHERSVPAHAISKSPASKSCARTSPPRPERVRAWRSFPSSSTPA